MTICQVYDTGVSSGGNQVSLSKRRSVLLRLRIVSSPALFCVTWGKNADLHNRVNNLVHIDVLQVFSLFRAFADHPRETQIFLYSDQQVGGPLI